MQLVNVSLSDAAVLAELHARGFPEEAWSEEAMRTLIAMPGCFGLMAVSAGPGGAGPEGFVLARVVADEAEILSITVVPAFRRHGRARALIEAAFAVARQGGARKLYLEVAEDNEPARAFYAAMGFESHSRRRHYYPNRTDALVLMTIL